MDSRHIVKSLILASWIVLGLSACTTRQVVRFEDHPAQDQTYVETIRHDNYFVTQNVTHEFWLCKDEPAQLVCSRSCDGSTDLKCPAADTNVSIAGSSSNVR